MRKHDANNHDEEKCGLEDALYMHKPQRIQQSADCLTVRQQSEQQLT